MKKSDGYKTAALGDKEKKMFKINEVLRFLIQIQEIRTIIHGS